MLIEKKIAEQGITFAWWPVTVPEGTVWLEFVHFRWHNTEFGGYEYRRMLSQERYDAGERVWS